MRLPANIVQINAAQEKKFFELLSLAHSFYPLPDTYTWEESIDKNTGLVKGLNMHWFHLTYEYIGNVILHKRYDAKRMLWHRGLERMTQHPIDYLHEYYHKYSTGKHAFRFELSKNASFWFLEATESDKHLILEIFDYCQSFSPLMANKSTTFVFDENGMIEGTPFHWYQLLFNYIVPALIYHSKYGCALHTNLECDRYFSIVGTLAYSIRYNSPFKLIQDMYRKRQLEIPFLDKMEEHEYVKALQAREDRRVEREKKEKQKNR